MEPVEKMSSAPSAHPAMLALDEEHRVLAGLLEAISRICPGPPEVRCCSTCPPEALGACGSELVRSCNRLMSLMLDHFRREESLMAVLPETRPIKVHCEGHRGSHATLLRLYNDAARHLDRRDVLTSARRLERVVETWSREHAVTFDTEFARLLGSTRHFPR